MREMEGRPSPRRRPKTLAGYLEALSRPVFQADMSWRVVDAKWDGIQRRLVEGAGMMALVPMTTQMALPEISQKLCYAQSHPATQLNPRQRLWPGRLCGHVRSCEGS